MVKTNFLGGEIPEENMHYTRIACITIDSVMKTGKKNYPQVYLEECFRKVLTLNESKLNSHSANFEQVRNLVVILLTLKKSKEDIFTLTRLYFHTLHMAICKFFYIIICQNLFLPVYPFPLVFLIYQNLF